MTRWAVLTGEYPPQPGGVSDYTRQVAAGLAAAGDPVTVYVPPAVGSFPSDSGVTVVRLPDLYGVRGLPALDAHLTRRPRPDRVLVQYVPQGFGLKGLNLSFAAWAAGRASRLAPVWVMFHEVVFPFSWRPPSHAVLGAGTRLMARLLAGAAERVFVSIPAWEDMLRQICPKVRRVDWLPIPSNVPADAGPAAVAAARDRYAPGSDPVVGHFGTYGGLITPLLDASLTAVLRRESAARGLLAGRRAAEFAVAFSARHPDLAGRVTSAGELPLAAVPAVLRACDLLLQPYPDGVSTRRTSVMAGLANGVPVVSNLGPLSEPFWATSPAVAVARTPSGLSDAAARVLALPAGERVALGRRGAAWYEAEFSLSVTLRGLTGGCG